MMSQEGKKSSTWMNLLTNEHHGYSHQYVSPLSGVFSTWDKIKGYHPDRSKSKNNVNDIG